MVLEPPQAFLDWMVVIGAVAAIVTAVSTSWFAYLTWRPPLRKAKAKVLVKRSACAGDKIVLFFRNVGRVDFEVLKVGLSIGYKRYVNLELQQEHNTLVIRPGGSREQEYRWPPENDPRFGQLSWLGLYGMKLYIDTPNGWIYGKVSGYDRNWIKSEVRRRLKRWKTETSFDASSDAS